MRGSDLHRVPNPSLFGSYLDKTEPLRVAQLGGKMQSKRARQPPQLKPTAAFPALEYWVFLQVSISVILALLYITLVRLGLCGKQTDLGC